MPRGHEKQSGVRSGMLGSGPVPAIRRTAAEAGLGAIEKAVAAFVTAWYAGDAPAMTRCLHPEFVNRLMAVQDGPEAGALVRSVVGVQGALGSMTAPARRAMEVRVLDVRSRSASAVAVLGDWVLHVHLALAAGRWSIVNAMWEMAWH